jgi:hypothetical protein
MPRLSPPSALLAFLIVLTVAAPAVGQVPQPPPPPPSAAATLEEGSRLFRLGSAQPSKFADAAKYFAAAFRQVEMSDEQRAAWAYCRVRLANERLESSPRDARVATEVVTEVRDALALAPAHAKLQALGATVLADAGRYATHPVSAAAPTLAASTHAAPQPAGPAVETANFRVVHEGVTPEVAKTLADAAEAHRAAILKRWTGQAATDWPAKCVMTLHATGAGFAQATGLPAAHRGRAATDLADGRVTARRLELAADGDAATLTADVLPRELTHVLLADLFPADAPPVWAALGMAVLSASETEQSRYRAALAQCVTAGTLLPVATLATATAVPADRATEFHAGSASVVYFLTKWRGEPEFVNFLRSARRYGPDAALREVYGLDGLTGLETSWKKAVAAR